MEHFTNDEIFLEQVGFFSQFLLLPTSYSKDESTGDSSQSIQDGSDDSRLKKFCFESLGYDVQFWREVEYLISDMNCFVTHLMQVFFFCILIHSTSIGIKSLISHT